LLPWAAILSQTRNPDKTPPGFSCDSIISLVLFSVNQDFVIFYTIFLFSAESPKYLPFFRHFSNLVFPISSICGKLQEAFLQIFIDFPAGPFAGADGGGLNGRDGALHGAERHHGV
jgi:hypothetical protein